MQRLYGLNPPKKVVVIGPECTGKSELSEFLANCFNTRWVAEYAREYLDALTQPYQEHDLLTMARGQLLRETQQMAYANRVLICDTNLLVIKIWSYYKYGRCDEDILRLINPHAYDLYLLTYIDIPWEDDPQREHPHQREVLWNIYREELQRQRVSWIDIRGDRMERRKAAVAAVENLLKKIT